MQHYTESCFDENIFVNFVHVVRRMECGGHIESVFALSMTENAAAFGGKWKRTDTILECVVWRSRSIYV